MLNPTYSSTFLIYFTFILLFFKKSLDFFKPIIYHELIEDMFIFDYNPLLIYLYSP